MKFKQIFVENHKYNNGQPAKDRMILLLHTVIAIMIFMNALVSVNSAAAAATLTTAENAASTTMAKTLLNKTSRNPIIAQQSSKTSPPHMPPTSMSASASTSSNNAATTSSTKQTAKNNNDDIASSGDAGGSVLPRAAPIAENTDNCKSLTGAWGDVDPNIYYLCDTHTKQAIPLRCPEGRGYFNGLGYSGCIPFDEWPACVASRALEQVHLCDSDHMQQPWETMNPNKFYICLQEAIEPMLLNCGQGKGFVHVRVAASRNARVDGGAGGAYSEVVGCANWEKWRSYTQCTDYY